MGKYLGHKIESNPVYTTWPKWQFQFMDITNENRFYSIDVYYCVLKNFIIISHKNDAKPFL